MLASFDTGVRYWLLQTHLDQGVSTKKNFLWNLLTHQYLNAAYAWLGRFKKSQSAFEIFCLCGQSELNVANCTPIDPGLA